MPTAPYQRQPHDSLRNPPRASTPSSAGSPPNSPSSRPAASPKPSPTTGIPTNPRTLTTSSSASSKPAAACPPSPTSAATSTTSDARATCPNPATWSSTCSPGLTLAGTANSSTGTYRLSPPVPRCCRFRPVIKALHVRGGRYAEGIWRGLPAFARRTSPMRLDVAIGRGRLLPELVPLSAMPRLRGREWAVSRSPTRPRCRA